MHIPFKKVYSWLQCLSKSNELHFAKGFYHFMIQPWLVVVAKSDQPSSSCEENGILPHVHCLTDYLKFTILGNYYDNLTLILWLYYYYYYYYYYGIIIIIIVLLYYYYENSCYNVRLNIPQMKTGLDRDCGAHIGDPYSELVILMINEEENNRTLRNHYTLKRNSRNIVSVPNLIKKMLCTFFYLQSPTGWRFFYLNRTKRTCS